jgi:hypothetical protein
MEMRGPGVVKLDLNATACNTPARGWGVGGGGESAAQCNDRCTISKVRQLQPR